MNKEVTCDRCDEPFKIKPKTKTHKVSVKETYFRCPRCKEKYIAYVTDHECRKLQREIKQLRKSVHVPAREFTAGEITEREYLDKVNDIQQEIKNIQSILKPKMEKLKEALA